MRIAKQNTIISTAIVSISFSTNPMIIKLSCNDAATHIAWIFPYLLIQSRLSAMIQLYPQQHHEVKLHGYAVSMHGTARCPHHVVYLANLYLFMYSKPLLLTYRIQVRLQATHC